jgi:hypothetical protein
MAGIPARTDSTASDAKNAMPDSSSIMTSINGNFPPPPAPPAAAYQYHQAVSRSANSTAGSNVIPGETSDLIPEQNAMHSSRIGTPTQEASMAQKTPMSL